MRRSSLRRAAVLLSTTILLISLAIGIPASGFETHPAGDSGPPFSNRAGVAASIMVHDNPLDVEAQMDAMAEADIGMVRIVFMWLDVEPVKGTWDWSATDRIVSEAEERGIEILGVLGGPTPWSNGGMPANFPPTDFGAWQDYVYRICSRYKGKINAWEVWNEENIHGFWSTGPDPVAYVNLLKNTTPAVRAADPEITIVMGGVAGLDPNYLNACLQNGAADYVDAIAYHPYTFVLTWNYHPQELLCRNLVQWVRDLISSYTSRPLEIWLTEFGWSTTEVSYQLQADYLLRSYLNYASTGVDKIIWYDMWSGLENPNDLLANFRLVEHDFNPRPSYNYLKRFIEVFGDAYRVNDDAVTRATCANPSSLELHCFDTLDGGLAIGVWKSDGIKDNLSLNVIGNGLLDPVAVDPATGERSELDLERDESGTLSVNGLEAGSTPLLLKFEPEHAPEEMPAGPGTEPQVQPGSIEGAVTGIENRPAAGCELELCGIDGAALKSNKTDGYGRFSIPNLSPGLYKLRFTDPGGVYIEEWYDEKENSESANAISVSAGQTVQVDIVLEAEPQNGPAAEKGLTWYLPEGYTGGLFDTWVLVQNPGDETASVTLDFQLPPGNSAPSYSFELPAKTRKSVNLDALSGLSGTEVSTMVTSSRPVIAERSSYFNYNEKSGGDCSTGITELSDTWFLAEGCTGKGFETWVLVQNPGDETASVTLDFQLPPGTGAPPYSFDLPGKSRKSVKLNSLPGLSGTDVSTKVRSSVPVAAERAVYFNYEGKTGGHDSIGVSAPSNNWYIAEGYTGGSFDTWVLVQNPGDEDALVTLDFQLLPGNSAPSYSFELPAKTRKSIKLDSLPGLSGADVSTMVRSDKPVVAERSMYFFYGWLAGGHNSIGADHPDKKWYLTEGYTGGFFETWVLVQNPGEEKARVTLDFQLPTGKSAPSYSFELPGNSRKSVKLNGLPGLSGTDVATIVSSDKPVVAERSMYFLFGFRTGGHSSIGVTGIGDL
ncbi:MAG: cellulase family glycosylhydrolase [Actinobacteria bacterium]|nr:cellulase family glycosylhydrolase [Actinomycetota bacterium]